MHYLSFSKERAGQLANYLFAINKGQSSMEAASASFGDLAKLDRELDRYKQGKMSYLRVPADKIRIGPVDIRELSAGANAIMPVMMRSRRGVDADGAKQVVLDARAAAAAYPGDPFVQLALAEAEIDAGNLGACDKAADNVLAVEPNNVRALVFKGRVAIAKLEDAAKSTPEDWKQARRWFVKANHAEPDAPAPLLAFYTSFAAEGVVPTPNAVTGLRAAASLAPEDEGIRLMLAHQYLVDKKLPEARAALATAAYNPHGGPIADAAGRVIAALDKDGADAALKAWDEKPDEAKAAAGSH
jgi:tetratricopeptide (TPR) repeat protein